MESAELERVLAKVTDDETSISYAAARLRRHGIQDLTSFLRASDNDVTNAFIVDDQNEFLRTALLVAVSAWQAAPVQA